MKIRWAGHAARMEEARNACSILVRNFERKRTLGKRRRSWKDNIKIGPI
jgi:hypothetical protein